MSTAPNHIKIVGIPPGEAPTEIRMAWVGLVLPVAPGRGRALALVQGVLTGKGGFFGILTALFRGGIADGYPVLVLDALRILQAGNPLAAKWWWNNAPERLLLPTAKFLFPADVARVTD